MGNSHKLPIHIDKIYNYQRYLYFPLKETLEPLKNQFDIYQSTMARSCLKSVSDETAGVGWANARQGITTKMVTKPTFGIISWHANTNV